MCVHSLKSIKEITMRNISVFIQGGTTTLKFEKPIATYASLLAAKEVTVFWNFRNITNAIDNGKFSIEKGTGSSAVVEDKALGEGYWDFQQLKERLDGEKLKLSMNVYDNTCSIVNNTGGKVNLKKFGELLGFPENHELAAGSTTASPKSVDVNHGLRWLTVTCDLIDSSKNTDLNGDQSEVLAFLPITPGTRLNSNCYVYERDAYAWRPAKNDVVTEMKFTVKSNISEKVDVDILMNIALE